MIFNAINNLVEYGISKNLLTTEDRAYTVNRIIEILALDEFEEPKCVTSDNLAEILETICDYAVEKGLIEDSVTYRDLFDTKIMGALMPRPSEVIKTFWDKYSQNPKDATDWYYELSCNSNYIRRDRIKKDLKWVADTEFGALDITVNLSKPEKDPKAIAAAKLQKQSGYPKCLLCKENAVFTLCLLQRALHRF